MGFTASGHTSRKIRCIVFICLFLSWKIINCQSTYAETWTILASRGLDSEKNAIDLLSAELSSIPGIELVERVDIQSLLREQQLSVFVDETDSLSLGRLLGVDGFAIWEDLTVQPSQLAGRLVCFDGATGGRLSDRLLTGMRLEDLTGMVQDAIREATAKRDTLTLPEVTFVSISSIRDSVPEHLRQQIPAIIQEIERALANQPNVVLLERERLRYVLQERMLPIARDQAHLLAAAQSVTLELSVHAGKELGAALRIHHPLDEPPLELTWKSGPNDTDEFDRRLRRSLSDRAKRLQKRQRDSRSQSRHEVALLEAEGLRLDSIGAPMATAVRWEAAYLLDPHHNRLSLLAQSLGGAICEAFVDPRTYTKHMYDHVHEFDGRRRQTPEAVPLAPEEMWLRAFDVAEYRLSIQEQLNNIPPHNELMELGSFLFHFAYLKPEHHPRAISRARNFLEREEAFLLKRNAVFNPNPKQPLSEQQRRASAAAIRFELFCSAGRYLISDWQAEFLTRIRDVDPQDWRIPDNASTREALIELTPSERDAFFRLAGTSFPTEKEQLPLSYLSTQLWLDAYYGHENVLQTLPRRVEQFVSDVTDMLISKNEDPIHKHLGLAMPSGSVTVPSEYAFGQELISQALDLPCQIRHAQISVKAVRRLMDHGIVHADLVCSLNPRVPDERILMENALRILSGEGSRYDTDSRRHLIAAIQYRLGKTAPVVNLESKMKLIFPASRRRTAECEVIHACRSPTGILVFTRRHDQVKSSWLVEIHRHRDGSPDRILGAYAFSDEVVTSSEARLKILPLKTGHRPLNFFDLTISTAVPQMNDDCVILPTAMGGIVVYPISGLPAFVLDESAGLPSNFVQSMALYSDTLFAWVGPQGISGSLVAIDLKSRKARTLSSTTQEALTSPLNNFPTGQCLGMAISSDGASLDMLMSGVRDARCGLWRLDLSSEQMHPVATGDFLSTWMALNKESLIFDKSGILFGKDRGVSGQRFSDITTIHSKSLDTKDTPRPPDVDYSYLPLSRDSDRRIWIFPRSARVIEERRSTGEVARFDLMIKRQGEMMKWCDISPDGDSMVWYSNRRVWVTQWSSLVP